MQKIADYFSVSQTPIFQIVHGITWKHVAPLLMAISILSGFSETDVTFNLSDPQYGISMTTNIEVVLQAEGININGTVQMLPITLYGWTSTNGSYTFTNLSAPVSLPSYWHFTIPANSNPQGNGPPQTYQGDIIVTSTNLGTISASTILAGNGPTYPYGSGWAWSAQASDLRYNQTTNVLTSYVQIGQLNSTSNSIVGLIPSTNGFISLANLAGYATTNYANSVTQNFTSIVFSNPASYFTPTQITNAINALATTNGIPAATATNIANGVYSNNAAGYLVAAATNSAASTNFVNTSIINATNTLAGTNFVITSIASATNTAAQTNWVGQNFALQSAFSYGTNSVMTNQTAALAVASNALSAQITASTNGLNFAIGASNSLLLAKQPASAILTNLAVTGAFTNAIAAGQNFSLTTNISGNTITFNATNQTFLTNGLGQWVGLLPSAYLGTNALPALTNGFVGSSITNGLASIAYVNSVASAGANTNQYAAGQNVTLTTNVSGSITYINATNQTFLTNGLSLVVGLNPATLATTGQLSTAIASLGTGATNLAYAVGQGSTNLAYAIADAGSNNVLSVSNNLKTAYQSAIQSATNGAVFNGDDSATIGTVILGPSAQVHAGTINGNVINSVHDVSAGGYVYAGSGFSGDGSQLSNLNYNSITNQLGIAGFQSITNGFAQGFFGLGTKTNFLITTNVIGILGNGAGTYVNSGGVWTNMLVPSYTIQISGSFFYLYSNSTALYQSADAHNWTQLPGSPSPAPHGDIGSKWRMDGVALDGYVYSTNIAAQIAASKGGNTNFVLSGAVQGATTNNSFSTAGTNTIVYLVGLYSTAPTNGISTNALQSILQSSNYASVPFTTNLTYVTSNSLAAQILSVSGVTLTAVTNIANGQTNGLATTAYVLTQINSGTNGLATITYVNNATNGFVGAAITNGIASLVAVTNAILNATNPLATLTFVTNYVAANGGSGGSATNAIGNKNGVGTNATIYGLNLASSPASNFVTISFADGAFLSATDTYSITTGAAGGIYFETGAQGQPLLEFYSTVIGGQGNDARTWNHYGSIFGGQNNLIGQNGGADNNQGDYATILGGYNNAIGINGASHIGNYSTIAGGAANEIDSDFSFAAGEYNHLTHSNVFSWNDGLPIVYSSTNNTFLIHALNGVAININNPNGYALEVNGAVDSSVGYTIKGIPVSQVAAQAGASYNVASAPTGWNGIYTNTLLPNFSNGEGTIYPAGYSFSSSYGVSWGPFAYAIILTNLNAPQSAGMTWFTNTVNGSNLGTYNAYNGIAVNPVVTLNSASGNGSINNTFQTNVTLVSNMASNTITANDAKSNLLFGVNGTNISGGVITIGNSNSVTTFAGTVVGIGTPSGVVTNLVLRPNGTNDSTAVIQAAFSTPNSVVYFTPGNYYATNLWLTSNIVVLGNGSTLYQLATASQFPYSTNTDWINNTNWNALINCGNLPVNQSIYNLKLDGMKPANYEAFNFPIWTGTNNGFFTLGADGNYAATNNFGLIINEAAGGEVSGCTAQNFGGAGYFIASSYDQLSYLTARTAFHDNSSYSNFCGFYVQSWGGTHPNFFGNAEYAEQHDLVANNCAIGGDFGASNEQVHDSALNYNYIGMVVVGGNGNSGPHTRTHHMNLNHNYCGFWIGTCDFLAVDNLYAAINTTNFIKNGYKIQFNDSSFGNCWFDNQGYLGYTTNLVTFQGGGELFNIASTGGNMDFESTLIGGLISFTNANVNAFNNVAMYPFTNWTWTVITNLGGGTYNGNNNHLFNGTQTDNGTFTGTFTGNGSGLDISGTKQTNMNLVSSLNGTTAVSVNGAQLVDAAGNQALNWNSHAFPNGWNDAGATNYSADALNNTASHPFNATNAANVFSGSFAGNGSGLTNYYVFDTSISNVTFNLVSGQYTVWKPIGLNTLYLVGNGTTNTVFGTQIVPVITVGTNFYLGN